MRARGGRGTGWGCQRSPRRPHGFCAVLRPLPPYPWASPKSLSSTNLCSGPSSSAASGLHHHHLRKPEPSVRRARVQAPHTGSAPRSTWCLAPGLPPAGILGAGLASIPLTPMFPRGNILPHSPSPGHRPRRACRPWKEPVLHPPFPVSVVLSKGCLSHGSCIQPWFSSSACE